MKLGTIIRLPDGREGTVVYNGLDGIGIKWGRHVLNYSDFDGTTGGLCDDSPILKSRGFWPFPWAPDAMLREPYSGSDIECVGDIYTIIKE